MNNNKKNIIQLLLSIIHKTYLHKYCIVVIHVIYVGTHIDTFLI